MDEQLKKILTDFSIALHEYEKLGGDVPNDVDIVWVQVTDILNYV